jgi:hypothetical protein
MSRPITPESHAAFYAAETEEVFVILLTLTHPDMAEPLRVSSDAVDTDSRGNIFIAYPFNLSLPDDEDNRPPRARLAIDNIDRQIMQAVRQLTSSPTVLLEIVRAAAPDVVEAKFEDFRFTNISYDSHMIEGDLTVEDFTAEPYPAASFSPSLFPGLF